MKKIYKLKNWYSLDEAIERLEGTLKEEVSMRNLLHLIYEGHSNISCLLSSTPAKKDFDRNEEDKIIFLNGVYTFVLNTFDLESEKAFYNVVTTGELDCPFDGLIVMGSEGEKYTLQNQICIDGKHKFTCASIFPHSAEWGITKADIEHLEAKLTIDSLCKHTTDIHPRERNTMLKIIIGMAIKGYAYNPLAAKNSSASEVSGDLAEVGIPVSDDTIRKLLIEATALLPSGKQH